MSLLAYYTALNDYADIQLETVLSLVYIYSELKQKVKETRLYARQGQCLLIKHWPYICNMSGEHGTWHYSKTIRMTNFMKAE